MPPQTQPPHDQFRQQLADIEARLAGVEHQQQMVITDPTGSSGDPAHGNATMVTGSLQAICAIAAFGCAIWTGSQWVQVSGSGGGSAYGRVTGDIAGTGSMADVPGMSFAVGAGEVWSFAAYLFVTASGGGSYTFQFTGPASPASFRAGGQTTSTLVPVTGFSQVMSVQVVNATDLVRIYGTLVNGSTAGVVQLQQESVAITQTVKAGSYLLAPKGS